MELKDCRHEVANLKQLRSRFHSLVNDLLALSDSGALSGSLG